MPTETGYVDGSRCPFVKVHTANGDSFEGLVDTGFNGAFFMDEQTAATLKVALTSGHSEVELAGIEKKTVDIGWLEVVWFKNLERVEVLVGQHDPNAPNGGAVILIGTVLLEDRLVVDFSNKTVEAHKQ